MKSKVRNVFLVIMFLLVILSLPVIVNAATVSMNLTSESELVAGGTVQVTLSITNIDAGEGIDSVGGQLNYDENIFEQVTEEDFESKNRWNLPVYNTETKKFITSKSSKVNDNSDIFTVTFKVKEGVTAEVANIAISEISTAGGEGDILVESVSVQIKAKPVETPGTENPSDEEPGTENPSDEEPGTENPSDEEPGNESPSDEEPENNKTVENNVINNNTKDNTVKQSNTLPKAGLKTSIVIYLVVLAIIVGVFSYIKYKKMFKF